MSLSRIQVALIGRSGKDSRLLDPDQPDDAAVLSRAEELVLAGSTGSEALAQARKELVAYCPICQRDKRIRRVHGLPGLVWPTCGHAPASADLEEGA